MIRRWLKQILALAFVAGLGSALVVVSGLVPIKASSGHWPITEWFLNFAMSRSVSGARWRLHSSFCLFVAA